MAVDRVLDVVADAAPEIRAGLPERRAKAASENVSGEEQLEADIWADDLLFDRLADVDGVNWYGSEERPDPVTVGDAEDGVAVAVDPLDGSSNVKSNNPCGTVVGVYDQPLPAPGSSLVAAAFVLYGPITTMTVATDGEPTEYLVEEGERTDLGSVTLPEDPTVYGFGGRVPDWTDDFQEFVEDVEDARLKLRYGGAMIADVNQVLEYGGVFGYPGLRDRPEGKLRACFESIPIAYIVEAAGGASSDGSGSLLDLQPDELHERTPTFVGSESVIEDLEAALPAD